MIKGCKGWLRNVLAVVMSIALSPALAQTAQGTIPDGPIGDAIAARV